MSCVLLSIRLLPYSRLGPNFLFLMDSRQDLLRNLLLGSKRLRHQFVFMVHREVYIFMKIYIRPESGRILDIYFYICGIS